MSFCPTDIRAERFSFGGRENQRRAVIFSVALVSAMTFGCKSKGLSPEEKAQAQAAQLAETQAAEAKAKQEAEEAAAAAAAEAKRLAEEKAKAEQLAADRLRVCCDALGKAGFEGRSMEYMKGADLCEAAHKDGKKLDEVAASIKTAISKETLPPSCAL